MHSIRSAIYKTKQSKCASFVLSVRFVIVCVCVYHLSLTTVLISNSKRTLATMAAVTTAASDIQLPMCIC